MHIKALNGKNMGFAAKQRGLVLFVTLVALLVIMLTSVALIRSTDANLKIAGTMAFKSDLRNQAERAIPRIQQIFQDPTGALYSSSARETDNVANHYYATVQATNDSGIPLALSALTNADAIIDDASSGVEVRYVIDRMCLATGPAEVGKCTMAASDALLGCSIGNCNSLDQSFPVYRITLRAIGPRNTEVYLQSTFSD